MVEMLFYFELFTILQGLCSVLSFCAEHSAFTARIFGKILCLYIFFVYSIYSVDLNNVGIFFLSTQLSLNARYFNGEFYSLCYEI